ncbi:peptidylprolyl isomerase, partial [Candidatus Bipolaricaulota bacterium]|nr:peptidylprolyl isomerase [Candidatus Bipolaricaulota bacterium]
LAQASLTRREADQRGLVITDEEVQREFDSQYNEFLAVQGWTEEDLALNLAQQGRTMETFKRDALDYVADQMLAMKVQKAVAGLLDVTDEQIGQYFLENEEDYGSEERVRASHILVETREEAEEILAGFNDGDGADFAELARERSTDTGSGANGGDLNWFGRGAMVTAFEEAAFALAVGDISDIVETQYGYHIILLTDRQDAASPELADVIDQVRADLEYELTYERALEWYDEVYSSAEFDIRHPLLDAIIKQADDVNAAIEILEQAQDDGTSDDPYLPFVLGTFYERKLNDALAEKAAAESDAAESVQIEEEIATLEAQIDEYRTKALAAFRLAQETVGEDPGIQSTIEEIEALTGGSEEEAP